MPKAAERTLPLRSSCLSGRHLSVHDDLDAVLARLAEVRARDLYVMRPDRLPALASDD